MQQSYSLNGRTGFKLFIAFVGLVILFRTGFFSMAILAVAAMFIFKMVMVASQMMCTSKAQAHDESIEDYLKRKNEDLFYDDDDALKRKNDDAETPIHRN